MHGARTEEEQSLSPRSKSHDLERDGTEREGDGPTRRPTERPRPRRESACKAGGREGRARPEVPSPRPPSLSSSPRARTETQDVLRLESHPGSHSGASQTHCRTRAGDFASDPCRPCKEAEAHGRAGCLPHDWMLGCWVQFIMTTPPEARGTSGVRPARPAPGGPSREQTGSARGCRSSHQLFLRGPQGS